MKKESETVQKNEGPSASAFISIKNFFLSSDHTDIVSDAPSFSWDKDRIFEKSERVNFLGYFEEMILW